MSTAYNSLSLCSHFCLPARTQFITQGLKMFVRNMNISFTIGEVDGWKATRRGFNAFALEMT